MYSKSHYTVRLLQTGFDSGITIRNGVILEEDNFRLAKHLVFLSSDIYDIINPRRKHYCDLQKA